MNIRVRTVWNGRNGQKCTCFQPTPAVMKDRRLLMTFQPIMGSDYYGPVMESVSGDGGETWSDPVPVPGFGPVPLPGGIQESICDVVPECHPELGTVLAIGHNVYYRQGKLYDTLGDWNSAPDTRFVRRSYYAVRNDRGEWTVRRRPLDFPCFDKDTSCCTCGCSQRYFDGNKLYIPFSFGTVGRRDRMFRSVLAEFDGTSVRYLETGNVLELPAGRGLLEPSLCRHHGVFLCDPPDGGWVRPLVRIHGRTTLESTPILAFRRRDAFGNGLDPAAFPDSQRRSSSRLYSQDGGKCRCDAFPRSAFHRPRE
ncbi:MAG: glycoside hydrolase [Lentisphaeria bacterium]|nr:MAG: glycoside hydrolase [Lentisphaeria bacterium]